MFKKLWALFSSKDSHVDVDEKEVARLRVAERAHDYVYRSWFSQNKQTNGDLILQALVWRAAFWDKPDEQPVPVRDGHLHVHTQHLLVFLHRLDVRPQE